MAERELQLLRGQLQERDASGGSENAGRPAAVHGAEREREQLESWVVTCRTHMHVDDWKRLFAECGYTGDYYWFIAE